MDDSLRPSGSIRPGVIREASDYDISLLADVPRSIRYLRVRFPGDSPVTVLCRVVCCKPLGCLCGIDGQVVGDGDAAFSHGSRG